MKAFNIDDLEMELFYGTGPMPEPFEESVLTTKMLTDLFDSLPVPRDDRIFVVSEGYWPHDYMGLTKDNGTHFILNDVGLYKLKKECAETQNFQPDYNLRNPGGTHFSGIRIEYINAAKASEIICDHLETIRKNEFEFEITGAKPILKIENSPV